MYFNWFCSCRLYFFWRFKFLFKHVYCYSFSFSSHFCCSEYCMASLSVLYGVVLMTVWQERLLLFFIGRQFSSVRHVSVISFMFSFCLIDFRLMWLWCFKCQLIIFIIVNNTISNTLLCIALVFFLFWDFGFLLFQRRQ